MIKATGKIVQINGSVIDVQFPANDLPEILEALKLLIWMAAFWYWKLSCFLKTS